MWLPGLADCTPLRAPHSGAVHRCKCPTSDALTVFRMASVTDVYFWGWWGGVVAGNEVIASEVGRRGPTRAGKAPPGSPGRQLPAGGRGHKPRAGGNPE